MSSGLPRSAKGFSWQPGSIPALRKRRVACGRAEPPSTGESASPDRPLSEQLRAVVGLCRYVHAADSADRR